MNDHPMQNDHPRSHLSYENFNTIYISHKYLGMTNIFGEEGFRSHSDYHTIDNSSMENRGHSLEQQRIVLHLVNPESLMTAFPKCHP